MKRAEALALLGGLAADQYGLITSAQAKDLGVDGVTLLRLREAALLENVGRGVYRLPGAIMPSHLDIRVAWLRLDPARPAWKRDGRGMKDGVVSHRSACLVHELGDIPAPKVELTVPGRLTTREPWVELHQHSGPLDPVDIAVVDGLPVTSVERTVVDLLEDGADAGHVGGVVADAEHRGLVDLGALAARVERFATRYAMPGAPGKELLSALTAEAGQQLSHDAAYELLKSLVAAGATAGYGDAVRQMLQVKPLATSWIESVTAMQKPGVDWVMPTLYNPVFAALNQTPMMDFLATFPETADIVSLQQRFADALPKTTIPDETGAAIEQMADWLSKPVVRTMLATAAANAQPIEQQNDEVNEEDK